MSTPLFSAAKVGDRISHNPDQKLRSSEATILVLLGQGLADSGNGAVFGASIGASTSCRGPSRTTLTISELVPRSTTGTIESGSPTVTVAPGKGCALAEAEPVDCRNHNDKPIDPGATTVLVQGLALARTGGKTGCGALLCDGAPTVFSGGPAASGKGHGTKVTSPVTAIVAHAEVIADHISACFVSVSAGAALLTRAAENLLDSAGDTSSAVTSVFAGATVSSTHGGSGPLTAITLS